MVSNTKHYVVASHWACDYEVGCTILGVGHTLDEAKTIFNNHVIEEKEYASEQGWTVFEDKDTVFDAGVEGYYAKDHTYIFIDSGV